jgi:hypothetical protein
MERWSYHEPAPPPFSSGWASVDGGVPGASEPPVGVGAVVLGVAWAGGDAVPSAAFGLAHPAPVPITAPPTTRTWNSFFMSIRCLLEREASG